MSFKGFIPKDFSKSIAGTKWRAPLGKEISEALSIEFKTPFKHHVAGRQNLIYLRHGEIYFKFINAAFQVSLSPIEMFVGLKLERGLENDENLELRYTHDWDFWTFEKNLSNENPDFINAINEGLEKGHVMSVCNVHDSEEVKVTDLVELQNAINKLKLWNPKEWCNVYIGKTLSSEGALNLGGDATNFCVESFLELSKLYWLCVRK